MLVLLVLITIFLFIELAVAFYILLTTSALLLGFVDLLAAIKDFLEDKKDMI